MSEPRAERTFRLLIAYDGSAFVGWQRQRQGRSVQGILEDALGRMAGTAVAVAGAGRTDAGVHATGQVASVRLAIAADAPTLRRALNGMLPGEVRVLEVSEAPASFHARRSARAKTYEYRLLNGPIAPPVLRGHCWHLPWALDVDAMRAEAALIVGEHDFAAFQSTTRAVTMTVRRVMESSIRDLPLAAVAERSVAVPLPALEGRLLVYTIRGTGFLRHMVRVIAGTLVQIGTGRLPRGSMARLLAAGASRTDAGTTAPACGLCLVSVEYEELGEVAALR